MVKKLVVAFLVVIILGLSILGWLIVQQLNIPKIADLKQAFPADAMIFCEVKDIKPVWEKIKNTEAYNLIKQLREAQTEKAASPASKKSFLDKRIEQILESEIVNAFGKESLISIYQTNLKDIERDLPDMLLATRISARADIEKELLEKLFQAGELKEKKKSLKRENFLGLNFKVIDLDKNTKVAYLILRDVLIISNQPERIKQVIGVLKEKKPNILHNPRFKAAYANKKSSAVIFFYLDTKLFKQDFLNSLKQYAPNNRNAERLNLDHFSEMLKVYGFPELDYATLEVETLQGLHLSYNMFFDAQNMPQELKDLWQGTRLKDTQILKFFPQDTILLLLHAAQDNAVRYYKYMKDTISELKSEELKQELTKQNKQFDDFFQKLGLDYENDVLPLLKETSFAFLGLEKISFKPQFAPGAKAPENAPSLTFPFPSLCVVVKVSNREKAENVISKAIESLEKDLQDKMPKDTSGSSPKATAAGATTSDTEAKTENPQPAFSLVNEEIYKETKVKTFVPLIAILPFFTPSFCFLGDYFVIGINDTTTKGIIDTYKDKRRAFDSNADFMDFSSKLPPEPAGIFYLNTEDLANEITKLKNSLMLTKKTPGSNKAEESINTISKILAQMGTIAGYMVSDSSHIEGDIFVNIKGL